MRDDLPADGAQKRERSIVNLDSAEGAGTHLVAYDARPDRLLYFDSYGLPPPAELIHYLRARGRPLTPLGIQHFPSPDLARRSNMRTPLPPCSKRPIAPQQVLLAPVDGHINRALLENDVVYVDSRHACGHIWKICYGDQF